MNLATFDTLLAFAALMLVLSMFVTAFVQFVGALLQLRSNNLVWGLERLFDQLDPEGGLGTQARGLAEAIVKRHPSISGATRILSEGSKAAQWMKKSNVLQRASLMLGKGSHAITAAELVKTLRDLAQPGNPGALPAELHRWLQALAGGDSPADLLGRVDQVAGEVVRLMPAQAEQVREAVHRAMHSADALARRVTTWFDTVMDRTTERFTMHCRYITMGGAAVVVLMMQVDALWLFNQLGANPQQRAAILAQVKELSEKAPAAAEAACRSGAVPPPAGSASAAQPAGTAAPAASAAGAAETDVRACVERLAGELTAARQRAEQALSPLLRVDGNALSSSGLRHVLGLLLSWALLSLGAPFWFNLLKTLSSLRPLLASRADTGTR